MLTSTTSEGIGIEVRPGKSQHFGAPLFQRGEYAMHELSQLAQRHDDDSGLSEIVSKLRTRPSLREADGLVAVLR